MSLEDAINNLADAIRTHAGVTNTTKAAKVETKKPSEPVVAAGAPATSAAEPTVLTYEILKVAFLKLVTDKGRDAALAAIAPYAALKELTENRDQEVFARVLAQIEKAQG